MIAALLYAVDAWFGEGPTDDDPNEYEFIDWKQAL